MGRRAFRVPKHQCELELAFALAFGCDKTEELWALPPAKLQDALRTRRAHRSRSSLGLWRGGSVQ